MNKEDNSDDKLKYEDIENSDEEKEFQRILNKKIFGVANNNPL